MFRFLLVSCFLATLASLTTAVALPFQLWREHVDHVDVKPEIVLKPKKNFMIYGNGVTFAEAEIRCKAHNATLASIRNQSEEDTLRVVMKKYGVNVMWIGARYSADLDRFVWLSDNTTLVFPAYTCWQHKTPDRIPEHKCVLMTDTYKWLNTGCDHKLAFACEYFA